MFSLWVLDLTAFWPGAEIYPYFYPSYFLCATGRTEEENGFQEYRVYLTEDSRNCLEEFTCRSRNALLIHLGAGYSGSYAFHPLLVHGGFNKGAISSSLAGLSQSPFQLVQRSIRCDMTWNLAPLLMFSALHMSNSL